MSEGATDQELQSYMEGSPFIQFCGMKITSCDRDSRTLTMSMPYKPELGRSGESGQFHGGPIASLVDTAGWFALVMEVGGFVPTINFRTDYVRPAFTAELTARAIVRRVGRSIAVVDIEILNTENKLIALGRGTYGSPG